MPSNKKRLKESNLYLILDAQVLDHDKLFKVLKESVRFGVDIVQLRDKFGSAKDILTFCKHALKVTRHQIPFILNDRLDLTKIAGVDGVHLGQEDIDCRIARKHLGSKAIIGVSCQNLAHLKSAQFDGADYVGFGSVFKTKTKPERNPMDLKVLRRIVSQKSLPIFLIGGINLNNIDVITGLGINRVAVCRDILLAKDVGETIKEFKKKLERTT